MMSGKVSASLEATLQVKVQGQKGAQQVEAIIDTGFSGFLTLPSTVIAALGLTWICRHQGMLADGSIQILDVFEVSVLWDGQTRTVETAAMDAQPLAGMNLLHRHVLQIEVRIGGN